MDEPEKTSLYGDGKNQKTGIYSNTDDSKTGIYSNNVSEGISAQQGISLGDKILLKEKQYFVKKIISKGTGEANVYQIEDINGNLFAFKLYFQFNDEAEEPNGIALERIQKLNDPDILKLIDFGIGQEKYNGKYCYEISDFALGGNILDVADFKGKYTPGFIEKEFIPQLYFSITKLHEFKIYHCDIKPGNILYKDKEQTDILIGDYGSAKAYDLKSEKSLRKSTTIKGTEFYLAPEQARGIVSEKNDYYSFGMVLLHLLYPDSFSSEPPYRSIDRGKFEQIIERQYNLKPIIEFNPNLKRLNSLIEGLTLINHINRWGAKEFDKWLKGEKVEVSYRTKEDADIKPLKTGPIVIYTADEFVNYLETNTTWFQDFFEDRDVYKLVKDWLDSCIGIPNRKRFEKLVDIYKLSGKIILKSAISLFLLPHKPIYIEGVPFDFNLTDGLTGAVTNYISKIDSIYKIATIDQLVLYFFQLEFKLNTIFYKDVENKKVYALLMKLYNPFVSDLKVYEEFTFKTLILGQIKPSKEEINYDYCIGIFNSFNQLRAYPDNDGKPIQNLEELTVFYIKNEKLYNDKYHKLERNAFLRKINSDPLIGSNFQDFVSKSLQSNALGSIEIKHISFQKICNVHYTINYKLDEYLLQYGINQEFIIKEDAGLMYIGKNRFFTNLAANSFINCLVDKHKGLKLSDEDLKPIKAEFKKQHLKFYLPNAIVSKLTAVFVIALSLAILLKFGKILNIPFLNQ